MVDLAGIPRLAPAVVARPHVEAALDAGVPLCVLRSPGGTGKTTALALWARQACRDGETVVWHTVDDRTRTREGFWVRLLAEVHRRGLVDDLAFHRMMAVLADAGGELREALAKLGEAAPRMLVVIDDFASVGDFWDEVCHDLVFALHRAATVRVVVAGRTPTLLEGPMAAATVETRVLDEHAMALTDADVRAMVDLSGLTLDDPAVSELIARTPSGAIQDARYALETLERYRYGTLPDESAGSLTAAQIASLVPAAVWHDLTARVADQETVDFLGAVGLAPYCDQRLARTLAELHGVERDGAELLAKIEHEGLGRWSGGGSTAPEFRLEEHVRAVAVARYGAEHEQAVPRVLVAVARWLVDERHDPAGAVEHALRAGDLALADALVPQVLPLPPRGWARLDAVLRPLPAARVRAYPYLALLHGVYLFSHVGQNPRAREFLRACAQSPPDRGRARSHGERLAVYGLEAGVWRLLGRRGRMLDRARRAVHEADTLRDYADLGAEGTSASDLDPILVVALDQAATSLLMGDDFTAAREAYDLVSMVTASGSRAHTSDLASSGRAVLATLEGRMNDARAELGEVRGDPWSTNWLGGHLGALHAVAQAWAHLDDGDAGAALAVLARLDSHVETMEHWELVATTQAMAELLAGRIVEARAALVRARRARYGPSMLPSSQVRLGAVQVTIEIARGSTRGVPPQRSPAPSAAIELALRAYTAAVHRADDDAVALLAQAQASSSTPLHEALTAIAGVVVAHRTDVDLTVAAFGRQLATVLGATGLRWPVMLLGAQERAALCEVLDDETSPGSGEAVRAALASVPSIVAEELWSQAPTPRLTPSEMTVLRQLAATGRRSEIAEALHVSINTVKAQLSSLYLKLDVRTRGDALTRAVTLGLLADGGSWGGDVDTDTPD